VSATPERIVIATRESRLALWQAEHVRGILRGLYPSCRVELLGMTTRGDQILDRPLAQVGGKGLFVKELETALLDGSADIAVHSMKDVPMTLAPEFALVAIGPRELPYDAFVSNRFAHIGELPPGAAVGTSSLRRAAQTLQRVRELPAAHGVDRIWVPGEIEQGRAAAAPAAPLALPDVTGAELRRTAALLGLALPEASVDGRR